MVSDGTRILGLRCILWHSRQANDAITSNQSILIKNHDIKVFSVIVNLYVSIFRGRDLYVWWQKTTNRQSDTHTGQLQSPLLHMHAEG